jgi:serine/threonine protein kinase
MRIGYALIPFLFSIGLLGAIPTKSILKKESKDDERFCLFLQKNVSKKIRFHDVLTFARTQKSKRLLKEALATKKLGLRGKKLGITRGEFLAIAHFINTIADARCCRYEKRNTGLSHTIEYDPPSKRYFIVLEGDSVYLDRGAKKIVSKAICYKNNKAKIVARAEQSIEMERELSITKRFSGKPGFFKALGFSEHMQDGVQYHTIYSKLYVPGSLQKIVRKNYHLTFAEKVCIAKNIAKGLKTLHSQGYVHRDLGIKNYLINIPKGRPGKRKIEACIADFGRTQQELIVVPSARLQGNTTYMAPEGHFYEMPGIDYYKLDVFAVGCVFYRLFYGRKPVWQEKSYIRDPRPADVRHEEHLQTLLQATELRRNFLSWQSAHSPKEAFEYIILCMLDTDPQTRVNAEEVYDALCRIMSRL